MEGQATDVVTAPSADVIPAAGDQAPQAAPETPQTASEGVKTPETTDQQIPYDRFKEVNDKAKAAEDRAAEAERKLAEREAQQPQTPKEAEPQIDPEAAKALEAWAKSKGLVTKSELETEKLRIQAESDVRELKAEHKDFDEQKVLAFAGENGLQITNKAGLKRAYDMMTTDSAGYKEQVRNQVLAELKESGQIAGSSLEKPGAGGAKVTPAEQPSGLKARISAARAKLSS